jgi:hypothetical protein
MNWHLVLFVLSIGSHCSDQPDNHNEAELMTSLVTSLDETDHVGWVKVRLFEAARAAADSDSQ